MAELDGRDNERDRKGKFMLFISSTDEFSTLVEYEEWELPCNKMFIKTSRGGMR